MGNGCSADQGANGGYVERSAPNVESPVFVGMQTNQYGGGNNSAPRNCPMPNELPPPCGQRTNNCEPKAEAQRLPDKPENITCNVTEWKLSCQWTPQVVPKTCQVMVPQYKAVCNNQPDVRVRQYNDYVVNPAADLNKDGVISASELASGLQSGLARVVTPSQTRMLPNAPPAMNLGQTTMLSPGGY